MVGLGFAIAEGLGAAGKFASGLLSAEARQGEFAQQIRALAMKKDYTVGLATARAAASGTTLDSPSTELYLSRLAKEFDIGLAALKDARDTTRVADLIGNISGLVGSGLNTYGTVAKANNWKLF